MRLLHRNKMNEQQLQNAMFSKEYEKTAIDKVLGKETVDQIAEIIDKEQLTRRDMRKLLYLVSGNESKLLNYDPYERYVMVKYYVWIREFVQVMEMIIDYQEDYDTKIKENPKLKNQTTEKLMTNLHRLMEHNCKFMIDLYFQIGRTSLSVGATGFMELLKNKFEMAYPYGSGDQMQMPRPENKGVRFKWK